MLKSRIIAQLKLHPIAAAIFIVYIFCWAALGYAAFYYLVKRDADTLQNILFYSLSVFVPYFMVNLYLSGSSERFASFYKELSLLISIPICIVGVIYVAHECIRYFNMGV
jgi:hypothetical protein